MLLERIKQNREYLAALSVVRDMYRRGLIDTEDFSALETRLADKYLPLIRYDKPCILATLPITLTGQGGDGNGQGHTQN